jgi:hypothetical protein
MTLEAGSVIKPIGFALLVIVIIVLTAVYECRAQNTQPATAPIAPQVQVPAAAPANSAAATATGGAGQRCVQHTPNGNKSAKDVALSEVNVELKSTLRPTGPDLVSASYFMPAGASFKVAINEGFNAARRYFGYVQPSGRDNKTYVNMDGFIEGGAIGAIQIPDDDALVKAKLADPGTTLLTLQVPDSVGGFWSPVELFIWTCEGVSVKYKSSLTIRATSGFAGMVVWPVVLVVYFLAALATKRTAVKSDIPLVRYFDPVYMTRKIASVLRTACGLSARAGCRGPAGPQSTKRAGMTSSPTTVASSTSTAIRAASSA